MNETPKRSLLGFALLAGVAVSSWSCLSPEPAGIAPATEAETTVMFDYEADDLPVIPLPNDVATRYDETSPTGLRLNASKVVPSKFNERIRRLFGDRDGWGLLQPITVPFTGELDVQSILDGHRDPYYEFDNDVIYLINIDPNSEELGRLHALDVGEGNYPLILERMDNYWKNDPRGWTISLTFEEEDEDLNGNGKLDRGEDTDADGVLDRPNYLPGANPDRDDLAARADALMTFYERETNTLIAKPLVPLREQTKYAVVITKRLKDAKGNPVGSPFPYVNHSSQTQTLADLATHLPEGTTIDDVAFAFSFTTQTVESEIVAVRDGLYGHGIQKHIGEEFPAEIQGLLQSRDEARFPDAGNLFIVPGEVWMDALEIIQTQFNGGQPGYAFDAVMDAARYVDYHVIGWYDSPQLFPREDENGEWLPFDEQSWPRDLTTTPAPTRSERVIFHLTVPRKEVSPRGEGKPAPVIVFGHGYTSSRFDGVNFGPFFAKHGLASIGIDNVSHGLAVNDRDFALVEVLLKSFGIGAMAEAILKNHRAYDQTYDGVPDSGADFWTAYMFHTRDVVRQSALDYMQLIRILRTFDGEKKFSFDVNGDGVNDIAGDFDGDGHVDIGGDGIIAMSGGSLGGMMSMVMGGIEPEISAIAPIVAGGGLGELGPRSQQSGVPEAFILRPMSPIVVGTVEDGALVVEQIVPKANDTPPEHFIGMIDGVETGDFFVVYNEANGERGCGYVSEEGTVRASFEADKGDPLRVVLYEGDAMVLGSTHCGVLEDSKERGTITEFQADPRVPEGEEPPDSSEEWAIDFQGTVYKEGDPLVAMDEGLGMRRASPDFRRLTNLAQIVVDPADPSIYARHMLQDPIHYPGTDQKTETHVLMLTGTGDMSVPASGGIALGRSIGLIGYLEDNGTHGKSDNQVLIDTYMCEAVNTLKRYTDPAGNGVHIDVDVFSGGNDRWGEDIPRLDPPLRIGMDEEDAHGGVSAALFPYGSPEGQHGFGRPGEDKDRFLRKCNDSCAEDEDCGCEDAAASLFDTGNFFFSMAGLYLQSGGTEIRNEECMWHGTCADFPPLPEPRENPDAN